MSVPAIAAGTQSGVSDVTAIVAGNSEAIDKTPDARVNVPAGGTPVPASTPGSPQAAAPAATGEGEQKAALGTRASSSKDPNAQLNPAATATGVLPTNHPPTKEQLKAYTKQVEKQQKLQKKAAAAAAKPAATTATPTAATSTPATATTPAATAPAATTPAQPAAASQQ